MALNEMETARHHLESAWDGGYRDPRVAYALGRVLAEQYRKKWLEVAQIADPDRRDWEKEQIAKTWRDPAIDFLDQARGVENESPEYVDALLLHMKEEHEQALEAVRKAYLSFPWMYEAHLLEGDIYTALGKKVGDGGDYGLQDQHFDRAEKAYQVAADLARSDLAIRVKQIEFQSLILSTMLIEKKGNAQLVFKKAEEAHSYANKLAPSDWKVELQWCKTLNEVSGVLYRKGENAEKVILQSITTAESILQKGENHHEIHLALVGSWGKLFNLNRDQGRAVDDIVEKIELHLNKARETFQKNSDSESPTQQSKNLLQAESSFYVERALAKMQEGENPSNLLENALKSMKLYQKIEPNAPFNMSNMGICFFYLARYQSFMGMDPTHNLEQALSYYERSIDLNPNFLLPYNNYGEAAWVLAEYEMNQGQDPRPTLKRAADALQKAVKIRDDFHTVHDGLATTFLLTGIYDYGIGQDPWPNLQTAIASYETSRSLNPNNMHVYANLGECFWVQSNYLNDLSEDASESLVKASVWYSRGLEINPTYYYNLSHYADSCWLLANQNWKRKREFSEALDRGMDLIHKAVEANPNDYWSFLVKSKLEFLSFNCLEASDSKRGRFLEGAYHSIEKALQLHPNYADSYLQKSKVQFAMISDNKNPQEAIKPALTSLEKALEINPKKAKAWLQKGEILIFVANAMHAVDSCQGFCDQAQTCFDKALELKPILQKKVETTRQLLLPK